MTNFETVIVYVSKYGEKNTDVEIEVELHGSPVELRRAKDKLAEALEKFFTPKRGRPTKPLTYNLSTEDRGKDRTRRRGYKNLFAGSSAGKSIKDLQTDVAKSLDQAYGLSKKTRRRRKK